MSTRDLRRLAAPLAAGVVTSAVVAAIALGGQTGAQAPTGGPPAPTGQVAGQLTIESGGAIPILSYSLGASNTATPGGDGTGGGGGAGKASFTSLSVVKPVDANTPRLFAAVAGQRHFASAKLRVQWGAGSAAGTIVYDLENVVFGSVEDSGAGGAPTESLSLVYDRIRWTYTDASGTVTSGWDVVQNKSH